MCCGNALKAKHCHARRVTVNPTRVRQRHDIAIDWPRPSGHSRPATLTDSPSLSGELSFMFRNVEQRFTWRRRRGSFHRESLGQISTRRSSFGSGLTPRGRGPGLSQSRGTRHVTLRPAPKWQRQSGLCKRIGSADGDKISERGPRTGGWL